MKKKIILGLIVVIAICVSVVIVREMNKSEVGDETVLTGNSDTQKVGDGENKEDSKKSEPEVLADLTDISEVVKNVDGDLADARKGVYKNLDLTKCTIDVPDMDKVYELHETPDYFEDKMTLKERATFVEKVVDRFFEGEFKNKGQMISSVKFNDGNYKDITLDDMKEGKYEGEYDPAYMIFFRDEREHNGKGFCQVDPGQRNWWMSRGELSETSPMSSYSVSKVYQVYEGNPGFEDIIDMKNGSMKVKDGIKFVENYVNNKLYEKVNEKAPYHVVSVEILNTDGFKSMGFRMGRSYKGIKFETSPSIEIISADDNNADRSGEVVMARNDQIENFSGLGPAHDPLEEVKEYDKIVSLKEAIRIVSESIADNSKYDIRSISARYQFVYSKKEKDPDFNSWDKLGSPVWKLSGINKNDGSGMIFYVNMGTGEVRYRKAAADSIAVD